MLSWVINIVGICPDVLICTCAELAAANRDSFTRFMLLLSVGHSQSVTNIQVGQEFVPWSNVSLHSIPTDDNFLLYLGRNVDVNPDVNLGQMLAKKCLVS